MKCNEVAVPSDERKGGRGSADGAVDDLEKDFKRFVVTGRRAQSFRAAFRPEGAKAKGGTGVPPFARTKRA